MANRKGRAAAGAGSIRKRTDGRWEGRFVYEDSLGQKHHGSVYAKTQKECRKKLTEAVKRVDENKYRPPQKMTVGEWLDFWVKTYCTNLKPRTINTYTGQIRNRIKPYIGAVQISSLSNPNVQSFYNKLQAGDSKHKPLSAKSIQNIHGILHKAMEQAVFAGIIDQNPCDHILLPKIKKPDLKPIMDEDVKRFLTAIHGDVFEYVFIVTLFSGLRQSEVLGLQWEDVNMEEGTIHVCRQLQKKYGAGDEYIFMDETKNGKDRLISIAPSVVAVLKRQQIRQAEWKLAAGQFWSNSRNLVFTDPAGGHLKHHTVYNHFKRAVKAIGMPDTRFHDLRHSYAISALQGGDSVKSVQEQLGHYSSAFTLDTYADVSKQMRKETQDIMERYIKQVSDL